MPVVRDRGGSGRSRGRVGLDPVFQCHGWARRAVKEARMGERKPLENRPWSHVAILARWKEFLPLGEEEKVEDSRCVWKGRSLPSSFRGCERGRPRERRDILFLFFFRVVVDEKGRERNGPERILFRHQIAQGGCSGLFRPSWYIQMGPGSSRNDMFCLIY